MTVVELIKILFELPPDLNLYYINNDYEIGCNIEEISGESIYVHPLKEEEMNWICLDSPYKMLTINNYLTSLNTLDEEWLRKGERNE